MSMLVFWVLRRVDMEVNARDSEEHTASILGLKMEAVCSSETLLSTYKSTLPYNPEFKHRHEVHTMAWFMAYCAVILVSAL
jgi:hypothetical protein